LVILTTLLVVSCLPFFLVWNERKSAVAAQTDRAAQDLLDDTRGPEPSRQPTTSAEEPASTAGVLVQRVALGEFSHPTELTSGRFLRDFSDKATAIEDIDASRLRLLRRGPGWVELTAPYTPSAPESAPWESLASAGTEARLRLEFRGGAWKLEDLKVPSPNGARGL
jgi:hypothetical protein